VALGGVYFVSLAAVPVPTQQFRDALGAVNIGFVGFLLAGVALRVVYPSVSYEGAAYWLTRVNPVRVRDLIAARFLFNLPIMLLLGLGLAGSLRRAFSCSPSSCY
jgi:hypothetical protein